MGHRHVPLFVRDDNSDNWPMITMTEEHIINVISGALTWGFITGFVLGMFDLLKKRWTR